MSCLGGHAVNRPHGIDCASPELLCSAGSWEELDAMEVLCRTYDPLRETQLPSCIQPQLNRSSALPQDAPPRTQQQSPSRPTLPQEYLLQSGSLLSRHPQGMQQQ
ncbi:hypothetical protein BO78DRAFT_448261 [Aspergillus sclerotiicarbonarius CBS 121057]|uniref:Uncharacterized protein n=1 Tax=Aspergillus sclerotiicarbonarius (strain CBS 121057 / IBT 28362) TaxID=1448318 RepID=A0A319EMP9_ASPSB|nr:hypothetical protein BO78DRAFT_448261 [Aspergillus sclerotiicarbonarius CBS 121057]